MTIYGPAPVDLVTVRAASDGNPTPSRRAIDQLRPGGQLVLLCLTELLPPLPPRNQLILKRRYFDQRTQREVADEIGVSQMQVSRLRTQTIAGLRWRLGETEASRAS